MIQKCQITLFQKLLLLLNHLFFLQVVFLFICFIIFLTVFITERLEPSLSALRANESMDFIPLVFFKNIYNIDIYLYFFNRFNKQ